MQREGQGANRACLPLASPLALRIPSLHACLLCMHCPSHPPSASLMHVFFRCRHHVSGVLRRQERAHSMAQRFAPPHIHAPRISTMQRAERMVASTQPLAFCSILSLLQIFSMLVTRRSSRRAAVRCIARSWTRFIPARCRSEKSTSMRRVRKTYTETMLKQRVDGDGCRDARPGFDARSIGPSSLHFCCLVLCFQPSPSMFRTSRFCSRCSMRSRSPSTSMCRDSSRESFRVSNNESNNSSAAASQAEQARSAESSVLTRYRISFLRSARVLVQIILRCFSG